MVLDVSSSSPVSNYLAPGDLIILFDGVKIRNSRDWVEVATLADKQTLQSHSEDLKDSLTVDFGRAYCASSSFLEKSGKISLMRNKSVCPDELIAFVAVPCSSTRASIPGSSEDEYRKMRENMYCLNAGDVITLKRCESLGTAIDNTSSCICSEDEACLFPVQAPGVAWVEISYRRLYSHECAKIQKSVADSSEILESGEPCDKTFLFVGDVISMARSLRLTGYQPRYASPRAAYFPYIVEKILVYTFHVSLTLALLNSLPVYFLDGESILGAGFCYITILSPRRRKVLLQACLLGGSILSFVVFLRAFLFSFR